MVFNVIFKDYVIANYDQSIVNPSFNPWGAEMIAAQIAMGFFLSVIFSWANTTGVVNGLKTAAIIGLLLNTAINLWLHNSTKMFNSFNIALIDILINAALFAIAGAVAVWAMSKVQD